MYPEDFRKLDTDEAALHSKLGKSTLEKLRLTGTGPTYLKVGRRVVYDIRDLESWLAEHRRLSTSASLTRPSKAQFTNRTTA